MSLGISEDVENSVTRAAEADDRTVSRIIVWIVRECCIGQGDLQKTMPKRRAR
jgi:hypothetical protein